MTDKGICDTGILFNDLQFDDLEVVLMRLSDVCVTIYRTDIYLRG